MRCPAGARHQVLIRRRRSRETNELVSYGVCFSGVRLRDSAGLTPAGVRRKWIACSATRGFVNSAGRLIAGADLCADSVGTGVQDCPCRRRSHISGCRPHFAEFARPGVSVVCAELVLSVTGNRRPRELQVCSVGVTPIDHT